MTHRVSVEVDLYLRIMNIFSTTPPDTRYVPEDPPPAGHPTRGPSCIMQKGQYVWLQ